MVQTGPDGNHFRRWFATLHPSLQLVLLQLWMPLFFIVMFCICYVAAFHAPAPRQVPIGIVGTATELEFGIEHALGDSVATAQYDNVAAATDAVMRGDAAAAYDPSDHTLYVAGAHQLQASTLLQKMLIPLLGSDAQAPAVQDLAPLPAHDAFGMTSMYLMLAWCIGGYMTAMFIGLMGAPLRHRTRLTVIIGLGLVMSLVTNLLAGPVIGAIDGHFWPLMLMAWGWIVAIGLAVNGLSYFFGRFVALPAMVIFVFLSVPASGAAYPPWMMPEPFAWLNHVVVGSGITEMIKHAVYGVGPSYSRGLAMMTCYAGAGLVLMLLGKRYWEARRARRVVAGKTTMFIDAQNANRDFLTDERRDILARHGLEATETGTIRPLDPGAEQQRTHAQRAFETEAETADPLLGPAGGLENENLPQAPEESTTRGS
ncbi:ABC transporter permease [Rhodococcus erythropolis]